MFKLVIVAAVALFCHTSAYKCADGTTKDDAVECDGIVQCDDWSDEFNDICKSTSFTCADGSTVTHLGESAIECDGYASCDDGSDELNCNKTSAYTCADGTTKENVTECDGVTECDDWSDEFNENCATTKFMCANGNTVTVLGESSVECDGYEDCSDGSDELNCNKTTTTPAPLPPSDSCGQTPIAPIGDIAGIVGGVTSKPGSWPWQVSLQTKDNSFHFCGGSIIAKQWILTAAHCVDGDFDVTKNIIKVGAFQVYESGDKFDIEKSITHPDRNNDIALLKLKQPVTYGKTVQQVCLPLKDQEVVEQAGLKLTVTGWGATMNTGRVAAIELKQVTVNTFDFDTCSKQYGGLEKQYHVCAATPGKDSCSGDSGGPIVRKTDNSWFQYGVVSFGGTNERPCDHPDRAGVYARITPLCAWIKETTGQQICK